ncbi:hypothetical protein G6F31_019178 [Rhizopus arrhizus]|nr:hypothetical protein G6F31_019178 [Rhizopus arrhizus]
MAARARGEHGTWTHPAVYWAAMRVSQHDLLNQGWQAMKTRWEYALRDVMAQGRWEPIPTPSLALVAPGGTVATREEAQSFLREILGKTGKPLLCQVEDHRAWAQRRVDWANRGETVSPTALRMAQNAMGAPTEASES